MRRYNSLIIGLMLFVGATVMVLSFAEVNFPWSFSPDPWALPREQNQSSFSGEKWELDTKKEYKMVPLRDKEPIIRFYTFVLTQGYTHINGVWRKQTLVNGKFPGPAIQAVEGDQVVIEVINKSNRPASLHLHGLSMRGTNFMDGMVGQTQCAIKAGHSYRYTFFAQDVGSYWYHNHFEADEIMGLYGPILIHGRNEEPDYDYDSIILVSNLYGQDPEALLETYFEPYLGGSEPVPDQMLVQGRPLAEVEQSQGQRNRFHFLNACSYLGVWVSIQDHLLNITEVDGYKVQPRQVQQIPIAAAQRYTLFLERDTQGVSVDAPLTHIQIKVDGRGTDTSGLRPATALLYHTSERDVLAERFSESTLDDTMQQDFNEFDLEFAPRQFDPVPPLAQTIELVATMQEDEYGIISPGFNNVSLKMENTPILADFLRLQTLQDQQNHHHEPPVNRLELGLGSVLDILVRNTDDSSHPFHMHGHKFWVLEREGTRAKTPIKRDTVWVDEDGWVRIRVLFDNPGVWGFHCHNIWHAVGGMQYVFVVEPEALRHQKPPREWWGLCERDELPLIRL